MKNRLTLALATAAWACLAGCTLQPVQTVQGEPSDGRYCARAGKSYRPTLTCTTTPVPAPAIEAQAKRFAPEADALTVYVLRQRWADSANAVEVSLGPKHRVTTVPGSLLRLRLKPGAHPLTLRWQGQDRVHTVSGRAGEVVFVELVGEVAAWGTAYGWEAGTAGTSTARAATSKLIADLDLRG